MRVLQDANNTNATTNETTFSDIVSIVINDGVNSILNASYEIKDIFEKNYDPFSPYKEYILDLTVD